MRLDGLQMLFEILFRQFLGFPCTAYILEDHYLQRARDTAGMGLYRVGQSPKRGKYAII